MIGNQRRARNGLSILIFFYLKHALDLFEEYFIEESLSIKRVIRDIQGEHNNIMFVLAFELKVQLIVVLSLFVLSLDPTSTESYVLPTKAPTLPVLFGLAIDDRVQICISDLHSFLVDLGHVLRLHRSFHTKLTILKV